VNASEQGPFEFNWDHEPQGFFIRGENTEVSLLFDSTARRWRLRICKQKTSLGEPMTSEVVFKERYCPTAEQALALANEILNVELREWAATCPTKPIVILGYRCLSWRSRKPRFRIA